jgi:two-component system chemotaxis response regulator CheB
MQLLPGLPAELGLPVFIVQHMPPLFTKQLAATLDAKSRIRVVEGEHAAPVEAGTAYIAPGGRHMVPVAATDQSVSLHVLDTPAERNARPSVNVLFRGMAAAYGGACAAAIMTGMGDDGYEGMLKLRQAGAFLMAQDKDSCLIFGMPARPVHEGLVDAVLDIDGIARYIGDLVPEGLAR